MSSVTLTNVDKVYKGDVKAVDNVSLAIRDQEFVVLVGPSGCGKTTTLRMIAGLEEITAGTIEIGERVVNDVEPKDRDIAMVFQNYALYPHMTVYKNLAFALKLRKVPKAEIDRRVKWAAETLGIEALLDRRPRQLSGGQRQRVAVGRAIVREPKVFLFDEPLSNLDAKLRVTTRAELKKLQQDLKTTTVYVTHDQEEAMTLGDRVVVMHGGKIQQCGSPLEVYQRPVNRFVAGFVGMPPMNFLEGRLANQGRRFECDGVAIELEGARFDRLSSHDGAKVFLGIRPEAIQHVTADAATNNCWTTNAAVEVVETLGHAMDLFVNVAGKHRMVCRTTTDDVAVGASVPLAVDRDQMHVFADHPDGLGVNLTLSEAGS